MFFNDFQKNAVIDSLQEQVSNAKDKLLRLMSSSQPCEEQDMNSSNTLLNSTSTQTTDLQSDGPCTSSLPQRDSKPQLPLPQASPLLTSVTSVSSSAVTSSSEHPSAQNSSVPIAASSPFPQDIYAGENQKTASTTGPTCRDTADSREGGNRPLSPQSSGSIRTAEETVDFVTSLQSRRGLNPFQIETFSNQTGLSSHVGSNARPTGFVSSEQLQEILQELSVDAVETTLRSPSQTSKAATQLKFPDASTLSPLSLRTPLSPQPLALFRYPSISPYAMRKRRPPFYSSRRGLACFYTGSGAAGCRRMRDSCEHQYAGKHPHGVTVGGTLIQAHDDDRELEGDAEGDEMVRKCQRCVSRSRRCSVTLCTKHNCTAPPDLEAGGEKALHHRHIRDSSGSWDSDSSSSTDYCYYHRPYCDSCLQRGSLLSSDSSSDSSDSEYEGYTSLYRPSHPVVFKEDIKPTFV